MSNYGWRAVDSDSLERVREELAELDPDSHAALSNPEADKP